MAQVTFNRELGANPAGITRFAQYRTEDGGNVTVNSTVEDTSEGSEKRADKHGVTRGCAGCSSWFRGLGRQPRSEACRERFRDLLRDDARV